MQDQSTLIHLEYLSERPFDEVVAAFEGATGVVSNDQFRQALVASAGDADEFMRRVHVFEGPSGFMRFLDVDHSAWMGMLGIAGAGETLYFGKSSHRRDDDPPQFGAALNVPVRAMIFEDPRTRHTRLVYDLPSSLMARLGSEEVDAAALKLDEKLAALAEAATGARA